MSQYPRTQNGWTDSGEQLRNGRKKCPNCSSSNFKETLSREICYSCGLECDYWRGGANKVYENMMARRDRKLRQLQEEQWAKEYDHSSTDDDY